MGRVPFLLLQLALLVLVFSIGFLVGRDPGVAAAEGDLIELEVPRGVGSAAQATGSGRRPPLTSPRPDDPGSDGLPATGGDTAADRAFLDPVNKYTVVVFTAENSEFGEQRAWSIHDYLLGKGYPVVLPRHWKGQVKIFVGAAGRLSELQDLEARLRKDPGPDGTQPFYDAYVDNVGRFR